MSVAPIEGPLPITTQQERNPLLAVPEPEDIRVVVGAAMANIVTGFRDAIHLNEHVLPEDRRTQVEVRPQDSAAVAYGEAHPSAVYSYESTDAYQRENPGLTLAAGMFIRQTMACIAIANPSADPALTYVGMDRAARGRKSTLITDEVMSVDRSIGAWVRGLPAAEQLAPVARPWADECTYTYDRRSRSIHATPNTPALTALTGGANDGLAVREREALEHNILRDLIDSNQIDKGVFRLTSLGSGTGGPAMDAALSVMAEKSGVNRTEVYGFDFFDTSLHVAKHLASIKDRQSGDPGSLTFVGQKANLLQRDNLVAAVQGTQSHVYEAVGFAEYVPSDHPATPEEAKQRADMQLMGCVSAEEFYGTIYDSMPEGSVLVSGNMRNDSPQGSFVTHGLGWPGIILRSTNEYLSILDRAGIPPEAVRLYVPDAHQSSGVYNMVAITKQ